MRPRPELLSRYELEPNEREELPVDWAAEFGREAPLSVEIGFGAGEYLAWWAAGQPHGDFVGFELPQDCVLRAAPRLARAGADNVRLVRGDARFLLRELFAPGSLSRVLMQFPMPWPKDKHAKHRVITAAFADTLADVLRPGACFELVTDQGWYADDAADVLRDSDHFELVEREDGPERPFHTRYERKWIADGRDFFRVVAALRTPHRVRRRVLPEPMKIVHLPQEPTAESVRALEGTSARDGEAFYEVKESFVARDGWLLWLVASDGSFAQHFYARITRRDDGRVLLRIQQRPRPYHTEAVHFALEDLARRLSG